METTFFPQTLNSPSKFNTMNFKTIYVFLFLILGTTLNAQVGINYEFDWNIT
ncbi:MAG: hypothetical protein GY705_23505 [Bacteroidetes bacterium]|nr:hypothetical protein [Bacteroidota bacterium]